jgi:hypothetical protein
MQEAMRKVVFNTTGRGRPKSPPRNIVDENRRVVVATRMMPLRRRQRIEEVNPEKDLKSTYHKLRQAAELEKKQKAKRARATHEEKIQQAKAERAKMEQMKRDLSNKRKPKVVLPQLSQILTKVHVRDKEWGDKILQDIASAHSKVMSPIGPKRMIMPKPIHTGATASQLRKELPNLLVAPILRYYTKTLLVAGFSRWRAVHDSFVDRKSVV